MVCYYIIIYIIIFIKSKVEQLKTFYLQLFYKLLHKSKKTKSLLKSHLFQHL